MEGYELNAEVGVVYFHHDFLGDKFFHVPELKGIESLLKKAKQGLKITGNTKTRVRDLICRLSKERGLERIISLSTLQKISK